MHSIKVYNIIIMSFCFINTRWVENNRLKVKMLFDGLIKIVGWMLCAEFIDFYLASHNHVNQFGLNFEIQIK